MPELTQDLLLRGLEEVPLDFGTNKEKALIWALANYLKWANKELDNEQLRAIQIYTTTVSSAINSYLRDGKYGEDSNFDKIIDDISSGLNLHPLPESIIGYKRVEKRFFNDISDYDLTTLNFNKPQDVEIARTHLLNKIKLEPAFLSTALIRDPDIYSSFARRSVLIRLTVPEGIFGGCIIGKLVTFRDEFEYLIDRGSPFLITNVDTIDSPVTLGRKDLLVEATLLL